MKPTYDEMSDLVDEWELSLPPRERYERMTSLLATTRAGDPGRAELLVVLAQQPGVSPDEGLDRAREAVADGGRSTIDARVEVVRQLLRLDRREEAISMSRELLRARGHDGTAALVQAALGEVLEEDGELRLALRSYTVGIRDFDPEDDEPTIDEEHCLVGRYRVRRALTLGLDTLDRWVEADQPEAAAAIRARVPDGSTPGA